MSFDENHFKAYLHQLRVPTKEEGVIRLGDSLLGTQVAIQREILAGMEMGIREFVTLKCRQIGSSTWTLAFDQYLAFRYKGMAGALVVHDEPARDQFRTTLDTYYDGLPEVWRQEKVSDNRNQIVYSNGSRIQLMIAGLKEKSAKSLGRSSALTFAHCTEVAYWGDPNQVHSLKAAFAQKNPYRFYHWESTANGHNHYWDMWRDAKRATTQRAIFVSWWANKYYRADRNSDVYRVYWGKKGRPAKEERDLIRQVKELYGIEIDDEQLAWYRWVAAEDITDEMSRMETYPWTEHEAFVASGSNFFTSKDINNQYQIILSSPDPKTFLIQTGRDFTQTVVSLSSDKKFNLKVWEEPVTNAFYVLGADPAYGSNVNSDFFAAEVFRVWGNRMEQAAEFRARNISTSAFAWILAYLIGAYGNCCLNLEIDGPGESVLNELQNLKRNRHLPHFSHASALQNVFKSMSQYMYRRLDMIQGIPAAIHTQTNHRMKERMFNSFRDNWENGILVLHSRDLLDEMKAIRRHDGDIAPSAEGGDNDDLCLGCGLATVAWNDQMRVKLIQQGIMWTAPVANQVHVPPMPVITRQIQNYFMSIGITKPPETGKRQVSINGQNPALFRR